MDSATRNFTSDWCSLALNSNECLINFLFNFTELRNGNSTLPLSHLSEMCLANLLRQILQENLVSIWPLHLRSSEVMASDQFSC